MPPRLVRESAPLNRLALITAPWPEPVADPEPLTLVGVAYTPEPGVTVFVGAATELSDATYWKGADPAES